MVDLYIPDITVGHILDLCAGPTTQGRVIRPPLFLHNITTRLGRHIYIYTPALLIKYPGYADVSEHRPGYSLYAGLADTLISRPGPSLVNQHKVNHFPYIFLVS
jgi:hypothetical protein